MGGGREGGRGREEGLADELSMETDSIYTVIYR